ncbi:ATP-dependent RNA helicase HrpA [Demequina sediminicola]|uniref:ATP-dependent RNA helicase HrpA n=1 Tax=Demequina sediminicola TaxID=1095026 RepID=UPI0009E611D9|nr:ATP-dependent RNA helicase HrpA [Demequina sediminicola]
MSSSPSRKRRSGSKGTRDPHRSVSTRELEAAASARRAVTVPAITYPPQLPVSASRDDIASAIRDHQVVIVAGETGSGKTTQLPKICLELGRGRDGQIGHTQPRRIAARSVADRIAEELGTTLGDIVGYQVRFTDESSDRTLVRVMTDGILLAQIQRDPDLRAYDTLIIDEAHERSLNIDFLLGYLTNLLPRRPDLKVIITSATIDSTRFARHFAPGGPLSALVDEVDSDHGIATETADADTAPVVEVTGRTYPVEIRYRPLAGESRGDEVDQVTGIVDACDELMAEGSGDILVFLAGERDIRDAADALEGHLGPRARDPKHPQAVDIVPLFSRLSAAEQHRVFESHSTRRIVLATNVAETSLTVPGIHYVVDPGLARISRYSKATKVQRLPIEPISRASANQRSGRAGRLADGIAIRLYGEDDFEGRPAFTEPEILRTSLASVLLQMISVGVVSSPDDVAAFPFVEPPDTRSIRDGVQLLTELGAIETTQGRTRLTKTGRTLSRLPMDPRAARMVVEGARHGVAYEVAVIAAALSIQDPRERPSEHREAADTLHRRFADPTSDLLSYLNLWEHLKARRDELSGNAFRREVKGEFLNYLRIREWQDVVSQIRQTAKPLGITWERKKAKPADADAPDNAASPSTGKGGDGRASSHTSVRYVWNEEAIHRSVLAGLLSQIGMQVTHEPKVSDFTHLRGGARDAAMRRAKKAGRNEYLGSRGARFAIFPGSPLSKKPPGFVMAAELVETSRLWARDVAAIKPEWAEELAGDLAKKTYSEPVWSAKRGAAVATEKVLLHGVPIVTDRTVLWGKTEPAEARELFIRHALVQGEWRTHHHFWRDNQSVLAQAEELEARTRSRGLIVDEDTLFDFYDERLPDSIISQRHFDRWWKDERRRRKDLLTFSMADVAPEHEQVDTSAFPDRWPQGDLSLQLTYQFEPGTAADGVTVHIPVEVLARVVPDGFDWLVPGMANDLATGTIRALPKPVRRLLVPAPDTARDVVEWLERETPAWDDRARAGDMAESYASAFTRAVRALRDVEIPPEAWDEAASRLAPHLAVTFRVEDGSEAVGESTSLIALQRRLAPQAQAAVAAAVGTPAGVPGRREKKQDASTSGSGARSSSADARAASAGASRTVAAGIEQPGLDSWPTVAGASGDALPREVSVEVAGATVRGYPALVDEGEDGVALRVLAHAEAVETTHRDGVRALLLTELALPTKRVTTKWAPQVAMNLGSSPYPSTDALVTDLHRAAILRLTTGEHDVSHVTTRADYDAVRTRVASHLEEEIHAVAAVVSDILAAHRDLEVAISRTSSFALLATATDLRDTTATLVHAGFVSSTPPTWLPHVERFLRAGIVRLDKAASDPHRDSVLAGQVRDVSHAVSQARAAYTSGRPDPDRDAHLERAQWLVEELRVSLFAQQLGTSEPVSAKRILKELS